MSCIGVDTPMDLNCMTHRDTSAAADADRMFGEVVRNHKSPESSPGAYNKHTQNLLALPKSAP
jgi:hypothetical protein